MSNFVRGGQLTFHSIRMLNQLVKTVAKFGIIAWLTLTISLTITALDSKHFSHASAYLKAKFYNALTITEEFIAVDNKKIAVKNVIRNPVIYSNYIKTISAVKAKAFIALLVTVAGGLLVFLFFVLKGAKLKQPDFIRGRELVSSKSLKKMILKDNKKKGYNAYTLAGIPYPFQGETHHTMIGGSTGSGKTVLISELITEIRSRGDKAIIYDITGTFTERFYNPEIDIILNPFDDRAKGWSLLEEVEDIMEFDTIAEALIGQDKSVDNPFWPNGARTIISELAKKYYAAGNLSTKHLVNALFTLSMKDLNELLRGTPAYAMTNPINKETTTSLLSTLFAYIRCLQYVKETENNFSIRKWIADKETKGCIFLTTRSNIHSSLAPLISVKMNIAVNSLMSLPKDDSHKTWFIFDELASLNYLPSLERGLTVTRNFGGCFVIAFQTISQLIERYGRNNTNTISANCNNKVILKSGDPETARWCSDLLGSQEVDSFREGMSYGAHEMKDGVNIAKNYTEKTIAMPSEIMSLPKFHGFIIMTDGYPMAKIEFSYKGWPVVYEAFIPVKQIAKEDNEEAEETQQSE